MGLGRSTMRGLDEKSTTDPHLTATANWLAWVYFEIGPRKPGFDYERGH